MVKRFAGFVLLSLLVLTGRDLFAQTQRPYSVVTATPTITITTTTADTTATPSTTAREAQVQFKFGTIVGSFSTCTVQAKTTYDGTNYLTLGSAVSVTATTNTLNAFTLIEQQGTTSVTSSAASSSAALGFGLLTKFTFTCMSYGTSAPVTVSVILR